MEPRIPHIFAELREKTGKRANRAAWKKRKIAGVLHGDPEKMGKPDLLIYVSKDRLNELRRKGALSSKIKYWMVLLKKDHFDSLFFNYSIAK